MSKRGAPQKDVGAGACASAVLNHCALVPKGDVTRVEEGRVYTRCPQRQEGGEEEGRDRPEDRVWISPRPSVTCPAVPSLSSLGAPCQ